MTNCVGRRRELEVLASACASESLVVLWGLPGVGKRALAREHLAREGETAIWIEHLDQPIPEGQLRVVITGGSSPPLPAHIAALPRAEGRIIFLLTENAAAYPQCLPIGGLSTSIDDAECSDAARIFLEACATPVPKSEWLLVEQLARQTEGHPGVLRDLAAHLRFHTVAELAARSGRLRDFLEPETLAPFERLTSGLNAEAQLAFSAAAAFDGPFALEDLETVVPEIRARLPKAVGLLHSLGA